MLTHASTREVKIDYYTSSEFTGAREIGKSIRTVARNAVMRRLVNLLALVGLQIKPNGKRIRRAPAKMILHVYSYGTRELRNCNGSCDVYM